MKVRFGFVSNSSSSSFLIATNRELTKSLLRRALIRYYQFNSIFNRNTIEEAVSLLYRGISLEEKYEASDPTKLRLYKYLHRTDFKYFYPGNVLYEYSFLFKSNLFDKEINIVFE